MQHSPEGLCAWALRSAIFRDDCHDRKHYHSHYASGNFTIPGTSSLLTGTYPWTHRAINFRGVIKRNLIGNDIFTMLGSEFTRLGFPQNFWVNLILTQFKDQMETLLPAGTLSP